MIRLLIYIGMTFAAVPSLADQKHLMAPTASQLLAYA